ncbi:MAG: type II toxin-antitoxin system RelE/ParE family toxin, partial [Candidatus Aminicenantes bacterium]|nr:type II toxin-antitoxin system RelE/ParE family toxin [Candidatus Aminicenantes bacterium]
MWVIERTDEIAEWIIELDDDAREAIYKNLLILKAMGPTLGRPYVDSIKDSRYKNMKELRVQNKKKLFRVFFVFDPDRKAILLIGGDKRGDKRFYQRLIPIADNLYEKYGSVKSFMK